MQLIASWGVSCEVVSIFSNYIRNLFYIFLVGVEKPRYSANYRSYYIYLAINESMCQSFCFLKALHLHLHSTTSTYGQA